MSRSRHHRTSRAHLDDGDETVGLAGWMYTDMLLGLVVVFLGSISVIIPARVLATEPDGEGANPALSTVVTSTTTPTPTTTTIPIELCTRLYTSPAGQAEKKNGIWLEFPSGLRGEPLSAAFDQGLMAQMAEEAGLQGLTVKGVGLVIGYGGYDTNREQPSAGEGRAKATMNEIQALKPNLFQSTALRAVGTRVVNNGVVGIEVYPLVEGPCS